VRILTACIGHETNTFATTPTTLADFERGRLTFFRVPYDHEFAAQKVRSAGLPERLARRLERGA